MSARPVPAPPEGLEALRSGYDLDGEAGRQDRVRQLRVWAEGGWQVVTALRRRNRRSLDVSYYVGEDLPRNRNGQRVVPERVAAPPELIASHVRAAEKVRTDLPARAGAAPQPEPARRVPADRRPAPSPGLLRIRADAQRELAADYRRMAEEADQRAAELDQQAQEAEQ